MAGDRGGTDFWQGTHYRFRADNGHALLAEAAGDCMLETRVREGGGAYRLIDVAVEGVSLVVSNRSEFDSVVNRQGLDALISQIRGKAGTRS